jgi:hypothetical protein
VYASEAMTPPRAASLIGGRSPAPGRMDRVALLGGALCTAIEQPANPLQHDGRVEIEQVGAGCPGPGCQGVCDC